MPFIEQLGMQGASAGLGGILDLAFSREKAKDQMANDKEMMDYSSKKQYEMWQKTGFVGQMEQLKKAGLNPAMLYGMGGAGGATTGSPNAGHSMPAAAAMGMMNQTALTKAQTENIKADTELKKSQVPKGGAEVENLNANTALAKVRTQIEQLTRDWSKETFDARIEELSRTIELTRQEARKIDQEVGLTADMRNDIIKKMKGEAAQAILKQYQITAETKLTGAQKDVAVKHLAVMTQQIATMINDRAVKWEQLYEQMKSRHAGTTDENALNNLPIIGGVFKDLEKLFEK